jgi:hypothetical protein
MLLLIALASLFLDALDSPPNSDTNDDAQEAYADTVWRWYH